MNWAALYIIIGVGVLVSRLIKLWHLRDDLNKTLEDVPEVPGVSDRVVEGLKLIGIFLVSIFILVLWPLLLITMVIKPKTKGE